MIKFARPCNIVRVKDGDTLVAEIDLGYKTYSIQDIRLIGIDTPELTDKALKVDALRAKMFVKRWTRTTDNDSVCLNWKFTIESTKIDGFGRWISDIRNSEEESLSETLLEAGLAVEYKKK